MKTTADIRKTTTVIEEIFTEAGRADGRPLRRVGVMLAIRNPFAGKFRKDLRPIMEMGARLGMYMSRLLLKQFGEDAESVEGYGKGVIVGYRGEIEHGHALITRPFGASVRKALGNATAWMASNVKRGGIGCRIDVPLAYKNALAVRSHYDTMEIGMPDAPLDDELVVVLAGTNRGRLHARTGGLKKSEVVGRDIYVDKPQ